jgi:mannose-6-phosphate isomerase-like protein (cupin superfamily)
MLPSVVNLERSFSSISEHWSQMLVGKVNGMHVKLVKIQGEFVWHSHGEEDEMFFVVKGKLHMRFREGERIVQPGEFVIVPHGMEHMPVALEETWILLFEPDSTQRLGDTAYG